jgi:LysR family transcriptional regulator (chromosome initiation inhibitor)
MLDYASLFALAAVVREGSFDRAARALHVTPSAVSQRIRLLEERVGCALVVRGQPCTATDTGRRLCQHADRVRLLEQDLHDNLPALNPDSVTRATLPHCGECRQPGHLVCTSRGHVCRTSPGADERGG